MQGGLPPAKKEKEKKVPFSVPDGGYVVATRENCIVFDDSMDAGRGTCQLTNTLQTMLRVVYETEFECVDALCQPRTRDEDGIFTASNVRLICACTHRRRRLI